MHRPQVLDRLQPSTLRVLRLVCRGWEAAASRLLRHMRPETVVGKQLSRRFPCLHSLDLSNALMGVDFASPRQLRLQVGAGRGPGSLPDPLLPPCMSLPCVSASSPAAVGICAWHLLHRRAARKAAEGACTAHATVGHTRWLPARIILGGVPAPAAAAAAKTQQQNAKPETKARPPLLLGLPCSRYCWMSIWLS